MEVNKIKDVIIVERQQFDNKQAFKELPIQSTKDTVTFSPESLELSKYIDIVKGLPEKRDMDIEKLKSDIKNGIYPPPTIINGLTKLVGLLTV
jgi:hypothetical protein